MSIQTSDQLINEHFCIFTVFTEDVILAQAAVFVAAGFETSSSTIAFALYEIAKNVSSLMSRDGLSRILSRNFTLESHF